MSNELHSQTLRFTRGHSIPGLIATSPARPAKNAESVYRFNEEQRLDYLVRYGAGANSYFNLNRGVNHYDIPGIGFISYYKTKWFFRDVNIVITRPVCSDRNLSTLLGLFQQEVQGHHIYFGIDSPTAKTLRCKGFSINDAGMECKISLQDFSPKGIGRADNTLAPYSGIDVKEQTWDEVDQQSVHRLTERWSKENKSKSKELNMFTRAPLFTDEWGVRKFYCYRDDVLVGFIFFDPLFKDGKCIGYSIGTLRQLPEIEYTGIFDHAILKAIDIFRTEGYETLSLGLSPLNGVKEHPEERPSLRRVLRRMYENSNYLYNFRESVFCEPCTNSSDATKNERVFIALKNTGNRLTTQALLKASRVLN